MAISIGTGTIDIEKGSRKYTQSYALNNASGVAKLLRHRHHIASRRFYAGDYAASDIIIDLHSAIESAGLTDRQAEAVAWVYGRDLTQAVAARIMGITQQAVQSSIESACERVAAIFKRWNYGEVTLTYEGEIAANDEADIA